MAYGSVATASFTNAGLANAVAEWLDDSAACEAKYGTISSWDVSGVKDMSGLFAHSSFNGDVSTWDYPGDGCGGCRGGGHATTRCVCRRVPNEIT